MNGHTDMFLQMHTSIFVANYTSTLLLVLQNTRNQARHRSVLSLVLAGGGGGGVGRGGLVGLRGEPGTAPVLKKNT